MKLPSLQNGHNHHGDGADYDGDGGDGGDDGDDYDNDLNASIYDDLSLGRLHLVWI